MAAHKLPQFQGILCLELYRGEKSVAGLQLVAACRLTHTFTTHTHTVYAFLSFLYHAQSNAVLTPNLGIVTHPLS